jgi:8-oxo-dGTP pyrophosphatase MutT (NUDIX family)
VTAGSLIPPGSPTEVAAPEVFSVVSTRRVYDGAVTALRIDEVVMPGGGTAKREVVEHDRAVAVVAVDSADPELPIILIEQYRHPLGRRLWELPAGLMDVENEPAQPAAARELFEETGFAAERWSVLVDVATSPGFTDETVRIYLATALTELDRPAGVHEEAELRVVRVPLAAAVAAALAGRIVNVMAVAGILAADKVLAAGPDAVGRADVPVDLAADEPWMTHRGPGVPDAPPLDR